MDWALPDVRLHGDTRGDAPGAVFIHGFGGCLQDWDLLWRALPPEMDALRYDLRGFGESRAANDSPFAHADDLIALLDAEGMAQADLVGISMGGAVAMQAALDHPERVRRLILISPLLMGWEWSPLWVELWRAMTSRARAGDRDGARGLWHAHPLFATTRADPVADAHLAASIARFAGDQWVEDRQLPVLPDLDRLPMLQVPVLLLTGARDMPDFRLIADLIVGSAPDVTRIDMAGHGHMLTLEAPTACAEAIAHVLRDQQSR